MKSCSLAKNIGFLLILAFAAMKVAGCNPGNDDVDAGVEPSTSPDTEPGSAPDAEPGSTPNAEPSSTPDAEPGPPQPIPTPAPIPSDSETELPGGVSLHAWGNYNYVGPVPVDGSVPWVWGFQGGSMIRPELRFDIDEDGKAAGIDPNREVLFYFGQQAIDEEPYFVEPEFRVRGYQLEGLIDDDEGGFKTYPFLHLLAWDALLDTHMRVEITIEQDNVVVHHFYRDLKTFAATDE